MGSAGGRVAKVLFFLFWIVPASDIMDIHIAQR